MHPFPRRVRRLVRLLLVGAALAATILTAIAETTWL
jgi:hypothetical protein